MKNKCLHNFECNECVAIIIEQFEVIQNFLKLVKSARDENMMISPNAFTIKDIEKSFYADVKLSQKDSDRIWNWIQEKLERRKDECSGS